MFAEDTEEIHPPKKACKQCLLFLKESLNKKMTKEELSEIISGIKAKMFNFQPGQRGPVEDPRAEAGEHFQSSDEDSDETEQRPITPSKYSAVEDPKTPRRSRNVEEVKRIHHKKPTPKGQFTRKSPGTKPEKNIIKASDNIFNLNDFTDQMMAEVFCCVYCRKVCVSPLYSSCGHLYCQVSYQIKILLEAQIL